MAEEKSGGIFTGLAFMFFLIGIALITFSAGFTFTPLLIFVLFGSISMFAGVSMLAESRAFLGLPFILMYLFIFTSQQPAIMGQAIFGYWWPQIQSFSDSFLPPIYNALDQAQRSLGDVWLMMTNPQAYFLKISQTNQVTQSITFNSPLSVEINEINLLPSSPGILEPTEPIIGVINLENKGDFEAKNINLDLSTYWVNPDDSIEYLTGTISNLECPTSDPPGNVNPCVWSATTYPKEMKIASFIIDKESWSIPDGNLEDCNDCALGNKTYKHSGQTVKFYANLTYNYNVNVSIPLQIINETLYFNKIKAGERVLMTNVTSEYTGGPVKATIFIPNQPARTDENQLVVGAVYNDGSGELRAVNNFNITFFSQYIKEVKLIAKTFTTCDTDEDSIVTKTDSKGNLIVNCEYTGINPIKPGEFRRVSFYVKANGSAVDSEKTTNIIGWVNYDYLKTSVQSLMVANNPPE